MSAAGARLRAWWPLLGLLVLAAGLRFGTLGVQSLWYDEAYTPVHVLHSGLGATLHSVVHTENTPPLWYVLIWAWTRVLGNGAVALRSLSALAGVLTVWVGWEIGHELGGRRAAVVLTAVLAVNPLFVWYAQEARAYALFALLAAVSLLWFLRAWRAGTTRALTAWSVASILALLTHYFAAFLVGPEALALLWRWGGGPPADVLQSSRPAPRRALLLAVGALALCGLALVPLVVAQGGHGTQWIGRWALSGRLVAIPGYFLLGGQSPTFGHGLLLLCAVPILMSAGLVTGLQNTERRALWPVLALGGVSLLVPLVLALAGADYLAPRNVIASWIPLAAALAVVLGSRRAGVAGAVLTALVCLAGLAIVLVIDLVPRYQRGDWRGVAAVLRGGSADRAVVTVQLGAAPLEYYVPGLTHLATGRTVRVSEVDSVGYRPLRAGATRPPTSAFRLAGVSSSHGLLAYRFVAATPQALSEQQLRRRRLTAATSAEVLVSGPGS